MSKINRPIALMLVLFMFVSAVTPMLSSPASTVIANGVTENHVISDTALVVVNTTFNENKAFNDDDFRFEVYNHSDPVGGASITLTNATYNTTHVTAGDGSYIFHNLGRGTYDWNVTWSGETVLGTLVSDGPDAFVDTDIGNLDWMNNDDDLNASIIDLDGAPIDGLNFSIHFRDNNTLWNQTIIANGLVSFIDLAPENYTWKVTVISENPNPYNNTVISSSDFETDGTQLLVAPWLGPQLAGDPEYYDLEIFTYYETSNFPLSGALVNATFYNGTVIEEKYTPANGSVVFVDLPIAYINVSVTYEGEFIGEGTYTYNLTTVSRDARYPLVVSSPGNQLILLGHDNLTLTWEIFDENPSEITLELDGEVDASEIWVNSTYLFNWTFSESEIGNYTVELVITDQNSKTTTDTIWIWVHEVDAPIVGGPNDVEFYYTETGYSLKWNVSDDYMNMYDLTRNGIEIQSGDLDSDFPFVSISLDGLAIGVYTFTFTANDTSGNSDSDSAIVTVNRDDIAPVITYTPSTVTYARGDTGIWRNWTATDVFMASYQITVDNGVIVEVVDSGDWDSETIVFYFDGLSEGVYNVTLTVT
ncbi:MAG: carboxypeptidase-like regulatory domain-containing protein, partial [Candidatus Thorarchaeota archaeon]